MKFDERFLAGIRNGDVTITYRRVSLPRAPVEPHRSYVVERWVANPKDEFGDPLTIRRGKRAGERLTGIWKATDLRILVNTVEPTLLHELTDDEARAQGFESAFDMFDWWYEKYAEGPGHRAGRFPEFHIELPVWAIAFELDVSHRTHLLHRRPEQGYTTDPREALGAEDSSGRPRRQPLDPENPDGPTAGASVIEDLEGEAVDAATLHTFATDNHARHQARRGDDKHQAEARTLARRARELRLRAAREGVDVSAEVRGIERELASIEQKLGR